MCLHAIDALLHVSGLPRATDEHTDGEARMNWDRIEGNWKQLKGKVKEQWG